MASSSYSPSASAQTAESQSNTSHAHEPLHVGGGLRVEAFEDAKAAAFYDICRVVDTTFASITAADYLLQLHGAAAAVGRSQIAVEFDSQIDQVAGEALLLAAGYKDIGSLFMADQQLALTAGAQRLQSLHGGLYVGELDHLVRSTLCNPNLGRLIDSRGCCVACGWGFGPASAAGHGGRVVFGPAPRQHGSCDDVLRHQSRTSAAFPAREKLYSNVYSTYEKAIFGVENAVEKNWCIAPIQQLYNRQALRHGPVSIQHLYSTVECCIAIQLYSSSTVYTLYTTTTPPLWRPCICWVHVYLLSLSD